MSTTSDIYITANALLIPNQLEFMPPCSAIEDQMMIFQAYTLTPKTALVLYIKKSLADTNIRKHGAEKQGLHVNISGYLQAQPYALKEIQAVLCLHVSELKVLDTGIDIPSDIQQLEKIVEAKMALVHQPNEAIYPTQQSSNGKKANEQALSKDIAGQVPTEVLKASTKVFTEEVFIRELKKEISREETHLNDKNALTETVSTKDNTSAKCMHFEKTPTSSKEIDKEVFSENTLNKDKASQQVPMPSDISSSIMSHTSKQSQKRKAKDNHQSQHKMKQVESSRRSPRILKRPTDFKYPK